MVDIFVEKTNRTESKLPVFPAPKRWRHKDQDLDTSLSK